MDRKVRTAIVPNLSKRVKDIMLMGGGNGTERSHPVTAMESGGRLAAPVRSAPKPREDVPSIFDTDIDTDVHLKKSFKKRQTEERSQKEVKKRQALIIQYLVANRNRKIAISDMERVIPDASKVTLRRDLNDLIDRGKIEKRGKGRATHYAIL